MSYGFDSISIIRDGKRWFPVMGEIHYSRVPNAFWADELLKMKAGGVDVVSAYTIWIHHEEIEGEYDWSGDRNLRRFVETASSCGMKVLLRIGPWCHGEVRNGGFPDWLLKKDFEPRTNDPRYLSEVGRWYRAVFSQVAGFVGSTIIGVQIENEFGHCGGIYEKEAGELHMRKLRDSARDAGFVVDLYTATGWGGAWTGGMIPVMGGYCDAPWDPRTTEIEPSGNYTFTLERNDHNIGSDHGFGYGVTFDIKKFPYLTAELGGGLQVTKHRRTIATASDIAAVALVKMGSGCNLLGFYMYHGGTNPDGRLSTLQESTDTGSLNDLPVKNYDFRAPIREFGQVSDTMRELKLLSYFAGDFGGSLCALGTVIPDENPQNPADFSSLRHSFRSDGSKGYVFVNNYVRHQHLPRHDAVLFSPDGKTRLPALEIEDGDFFFLPFNMEFGGTPVRTATVTPFCAVGGKTVFYKRRNDGSRSSFFDCAGGEKPSDFLALSRRNALNAWKAGGRLLITGDDAHAFGLPGGGIRIEGRRDASFLVFPDFDSCPDGWRRTGSVNMNEADDLPPVLFARYEKIGAPSLSAGTCEFVPFGGGRYGLDFSGELSRIGTGGISDAFVSLRYVGGSARLYSVVCGKRRLLLDDFFMDERIPWEIGLKRFTGCGAELSSLELEIEPLAEDAKIYIENPPEFPDSGMRRELLSVSVEYEWSFGIGAEKAR